jgi:hypothetical protein
LDFKEGFKTFFGYQNKDAEKPLVLYYAKYIGVISSNKSYPTEEGAYVRVFEDRIQVDLYKSKFKTEIPYKNMTEIQNVDAGKKFDADKFALVGPAFLLWKRHAIVTVMKYTDDSSEPQTIALDFEHNTKYAQPIIDKKMREAHGGGKQNQDTTQPVVSIADELSKLAKLKEQGVITEEEFSQMKSNLMKRM